MPVSTRASPASCRKLSTSPASTVPSSTPVTGLSRPTRPTVPASSLRRPENHAANASAVATTATYRKPSTAGPSSAGGVPSNTTATGSSASPPATSCHDVSDSTSTSALHFLVSTYPSDDMVIAATEASTPRQSAATAPVNRISTTPAMPTAAPARCRDRGGAASSSHANSIITTGEVAMTVDATLVGSSCAAT